MWHGEQRGRQFSNPDKAQYQTELDTKRRIEIYRVSIAIQQLSIILEYCHSGEFDLRHGKSSPGSHNGRLHLHLLPSRRFPSQRPLMIGLLCPLDMSAQTFLLLVQGLFLFASDTFAAHDHHDGFIASLFTVRRAARCLFISFALHRAELFSALATSCYRCNAFLVVCLCLLAWAENIALRNERRCCGVVRAG